MRDYDFGNFLRQLRAQRGLSQYQLGSIVGVSDKAVSKWENGSAKPQSQILYKLSDILGVTVDELLACKYLSTQKYKRSIFYKKRMVENTDQALRNRYGKVVPPQIWNRYLSELAQLQETDTMLYFNLLSQIRTLAKNKKEHLRIKGAIGASFLAFVMGATEMNPLKPHYYCTHCHTVEFVGKDLCGWDLPAKHCSCGKELLRDGHNIPFETLLPSVNKNLHFDLSVSHNMYQATKELIYTYFSDNTVVTLIRKDYPNLETIVVIHEEGSHWTNGQKLPFEEYYDRLRQYPTITLMISQELDTFRLLEEETKTSFDNVDFACSDVLEAFKCNHTQNIPEFGTNFFKNMINEVVPTCFNDLIQMSGLSHATGAWINNAQQLIKSGMPVSRVIAYRDDVFHYIQEKFVSIKISNTGYAYQIMQDTFRGVYAKYGIPDETKQQFAILGIETWFTESIQKIRYLFPKAHGVLYVKYAMILMWYQINYPKAFKKYFNHSME